MALVTRFGADPLLDTEIANKRYVDTRTVLRQSVIINNQRNELVTAGNTRIFAITGRADDNGTESLCQNLCPIDLTWVNLGVAIATSSSNEIAFVRARVNGINGNQLLSIAAATTGNFFDNTNSDVFVQGDLFSIRLSSTSTSGTFNFRSFTGVVIIT